MSFDDKTIVCSDCQAEFIHSATDQQRYAERGFTNEPKRCPACREVRKTRGPGTGGGGGGHGRDDAGGGGAARGPRQLFTATCAECGKQTQVPFKPTAGRPVYCRECYSSKRG